MAGLERLTSSACAKVQTSSPNRSTGAMALPKDVIAQFVNFFDRAQPVGYLAGTAHSFRDGLTDSMGHLRVCHFVTSRPRSVVEGLRRASHVDLAEIRIDFSTERLDLAEIERVISALSECLSNATMLKVLSIRLAAFDFCMDRLRISREAWAVFVRGLSALSQHGRLRALELSSMAVKTWQASEVYTKWSTAPPPSSSPGQKGITFIDALGQLSTLEELVLTSDEIFGNTALLLSQAFTQLSKLRKLDVTRNHIPKQAMRALREALPSKVALHGEDKQSFSF
eukprot:gnl/TRDRNA2_/TRDRNA2_45558_c0_seq1.p1 gnl/TRDRNA2_/TRDRNA2_45558_c0~~gnl/TRDRNA2_/TRDRNA2_45558_c0_seq1.p1  ORF type:complete len:283 (-),score=36.31 gnl/TRDRNA2_/TRDRNA2_45558_c0_seq1:158-1006(-)